MLLGGHGLRVGANRHLLLELIIRLRLRREPDAEIIVDPDITKRISALLNDPMRPAARPNFDINGIEV